MTTSIGKGLFRVTSALAERGIPDVDYTVNYLTAAQIGFLFRQLDAAFAVSGEIDLPSFVTSASEGLIKFTALRVNGDFPSHSRILQAEARFDDLTDVTVRWQDAVLDALDLMHRHTIIMIDAKARTIRQSIQYSYRMADTELARWRFGPAGSIWRHWIMPQYMPASPGTKHASTITTSRT